MSPWGVAWLLVALDTHAPARFELAWTAPEECPSRDDASAAIDAMLGDTEPTGPELVRADVRIEAAGDEYTMALRVGEGTRALVGPSCEELAATAAFIVAIAVDPRVLGRGAPPSIRAEPRDPPPPATLPPPVTAPATEPTPPAVTAPAPVPAPAIAPRPRSLSRVAIGGRVLAGLGLGPSPGVTGTFAVSLALLGRLWRAEIDAQYWVPRRRASTNNREVGVVAQLWTIGARGCGLAVRGRVEVPLCAVAQAGMIHAHGTGDLQSMRARQPWVGVGGGAMILGWLRPRFGLGCGVDVLGSVVQGGFRSEPSGDIDRVGAVTFTALCGVQWRTLPGIGRNRPRRVLDSAGGGQPEG